MASILINTRGILITKIENDEDDDVGDGGDGKNAIFTGAREKESLLIF